MKNVDTVVDTVSDFAQETVDKATKVTNEAIGKASKGSQQAVDKIGKKGEQLRTAEQRLLKATSAYVRNNPITSVGIAIGAGFLLSKWFDNR